MWYRIHLKIVQFFSIIVARWHEMDKTINNVDKNDLAGMLKRSWIASTIEFEYFDIINNIFAASARTDDILQWDDNFHDKLIVWKLSISMLTYVDLFIG